MTTQAQKVRTIVQHHDMKISDAQAEAIAAYIIEEGLKITLVTILEVVLILWVMS